MRLVGSAAIMTILAGHVLYATPAQAGPPPEPVEFLIGPGWEIAYDLTGDLEVEVCLGDCQTEIIPQLGGTMSLYLEDPEGDGWFENGARANLNGFEFALEYEVFGLQVTEHFRPELEERPFRGTFDASVVQVQWVDNPFELRAVGTRSCPPGQLCELSVPPTPPNPPIPVNQVREDLLGDIQFDIWNSPPPDAFLAWETSSEQFGSFVTLTVLLQGQETGRRFCSHGLGRGREDFLEPYRCIPEPHPGVLIALALVVFGVTRFRSW